MKKSAFIIKVLFILLSTAIAVTGISFMKVILTVPGEMVLIEGEEYSYDIDSLFPISIKADTQGILRINGKSVERPYNHVGISKPVSLSSDRGGSLKLNLRFFGIIPVKTVNVDVVSNKNLVACGNTIGVKIKLDGILVIGISSVISNGQKIVPARNTGIKPGSKIIAVNGKETGSIDDLADAIEQSGGKPLKIKYKTEDEVQETMVTPIRSTEDGKYHIGLWVRDSTAGIGTLTFYDADTGKFGALGHGITDIDTGTLMSVKTGEILESDILGVKMSRSGVPGELKGVFSEGRHLGTILANTEVGIYGRLDRDAMQKLKGKVYPVGVRANIKEGPATILSNIDGKKIEEYDIVIQKVSRQSLNGSKGMIIKITDERLLQTTGGIVQGMSGSPVIQDGKIVGAVTHVLVNDPTRGYGIFIETMLMNAA
ncbi:MAG TPA: SpoIVB peptidase [Clostridiales bacterium]|nr:SpoIVB peptidase [Clostridiales bacterium]